MMNGMDGEEGWGGVFTGCAIQWFLSSLPPSRPLIGNGR